MDYCPCSGGERTTVDRELAEWAFRRYHATVYRYLLRRTRDHHEAEDLAQEVFAAAVTAPLAHERGSILAWLEIVARRRLADRARRNGGFQTVALPDEELDALEVPPPAYGPEATRALREALLRLPAEQREVALLRLFSGRSFAQIASAVDASEEACRQRFLRALRALRAELAREGIEP